MDSMATLSTQGVCGCRPYGGSLSGRKVINSRYLIVSGSISFAAIQECLAEFFNPTHCEGKKFAGF